MTPGTPCRRLGLSELSTGPLRLPLSVVALAVLAALLHMAPYWRAQSQTPPGWTFTGNVSGSPDALQYRVLTRESQRSGPLVANNFAPESERPSILVLFYYGVGRVAQWTGFSTEWVYAYAGALFAFALAVLIYLVVRHFLPDRRQAFWVFLVILGGGGLGAHLKVVSALSGSLGETFLLRRTLVEGLSRSLVFEDYRSHYVFLTLFDTHFLLIWLVTTAAVMSLYVALRSPSPLRLIVVAALCSLTTLLHIYEGVTLIAITVAVVLVGGRRGLAARNALLGSAVAVGAAAASIAVQLRFHSLSGLPLPPWRAWDVPVSILLLAYPVAWALILWGLRDYWKRAQLDEAFLAGWALACTVLTLSAPFYPYPDRGTMTMQLPLYLIAGSIYFSRVARTSLPVALIALLVLAGTPTLGLALWWRGTGFDSERNYMFLGPEQREIIQVLAEHASTRDILMVDKTREDWQTDDLWLTPEYPGPVFPGHFFLSVDYEQKRSEVNRFFSRAEAEHASYLERRAVRFFHAPPREERTTVYFPLTAAGRAAYLRKRNIRFIYVPSEQDPERLREVPGLKLLHKAGIGSLFEFQESGPGCTP